MEADDVSGVGGIDDVPALGHEGGGIGAAERLSRTGMAIEFVALKFPRTNTQKGDAVPVLGVQVGVYFKDEAGKLFFQGRDFPFQRCFRSGRRRQGHHGIQEFPDSEVVDGGTEKHRGHPAGKILFLFKGGIDGAEQLYVLPQLGRQA